jgi:hypothetical protein
MKKKYKRVGGSWRKNWSSRGTEMMNMIETFTNPFLATKSQEPYDGYLRILLEEYPSNEFYKSLQNQLRKYGRLSPKQINALEEAFNLFIGIGYIEERSRDVK